jgi:hypothetical protein
MRSFLPRCLESVVKAFCESWNLRWIHLGICLMEGSAKSCSAFGAPAAEPLRDDAGDLGANEAFVERLVEDFGDDRAGFFIVGQMIGASLAELFEQDAGAGGLVGDTLLGVVDSVDVGAMSKLAPELQDGLLGLCVCAGKFGQNVPAAGALAAIDDGADDVGKGAMDVDHFRIPVVFDRQPQNDSRAGKILELVVEDEVGDGGEVFELGSFAGSGAARGDQQPFGAGSRAGKFADQAVVGVCAGGVAGGGRVTDAAAPGAELHREEAGRVNADNPAFL